MIANEKLRNIDTLEHINMIQSNVLRLFKI